MTHHATLLIRDMHALSPDLPAELKEGLDVEVVRAAQFGVLDARALKRRAHQKPLQEAHRRFVIISDEMTNEAQNALLKLFEDPPPHAEFFLVAPREDMLLPTLRSRLHLEDAPPQASRIDAPVRAFFEASVPERVRILEERLGDKASAEDWAHRVMRGAEMLAAESESAELLRDVLMVSGYASRRGASQKMLLEHLALSL